MLQRVELCTRVAYNGSERRLDQEAIPLNLDPAHEMPVKAGADVLSNSQGWWSDLESDWVSLAAVGCWHRSWKWHCLGLRPQL